MSVQADVEASKAVVSAIAALQTRLQDLVTQKEELERQIRAMEEEKQAKVSLRTSKFNAMSIAITRAHDMMVISEKATKDLQRGQQENVYTKNKIKELRKLLDTYEPYPDQERKEVTSDVRGITKKVHD
jgi:predicted  nucleic acid-binding Zn-ribbon protein